MLRVADLSYAYGGHAPLFAGVNLALDAGDYVAVVGESGAGKSTLLNLLAGLDTPSAGSIGIGGRDLGGLNDDERTLLRRASLGFVFQAFHVLPYLSAAQNIALPLTLNRWNAGDAAHRVAEMLEAVGLGDKGARMPRELSGGELQRVAIARALAHRPQLVLADEPTGNLDPDTARQVLDLLRAEIARNRTAAILVTHSRIAAASAQRVLRLTRGGLEPALP